MGTDRDDESGAGPGPELRAVRRGAAAAPAFPGENPADATWGEPRFVEPRLREAVRAFMAENQVLRQELAVLRQHVLAAEQEHDSHAEQHLRTEQHSMRLLNLFVAAHRLHSSLALDEVLRALDEVMLNLVGAARYDVCLFDPDRGMLVPITTDGEPAAPGAPLPGATVIAEALQSGRVSAGPAAAGEPLPMAACVPLALAGRTVGAIIVRELLPQKRAAGPADLELFELLGVHVASALCAACAVSARHGQGEAQAAWARMVMRFTGAADGGLPGEEGKGR